MATKRENGSARAPIELLLLVCLLASPAAAQSTTRASVATGGAQGDLPTVGASISTDGGEVAFASIATNLVVGDTNGSDDVFVHDRRNGTTERVSVATGGQEGNGNSYVPAISADGRYVVFQSDASNLVPGDTNGTADVFWRDRQTATTERMSISTGSVQGDGDSYSPSISADGRRRVAFESYAANLVSGDTNEGRDVFAFDHE